MKKALLILALLMPALAHAQATQSPSSTGNITNVDTSGTCATTNSCISLVIPASTPSVTVNVVGTYTGVLNFQMSLNTPTTGSGQTWNFVQQVTSIGLWSFTIPGMTGFRVEAKTFSSGTAVITISTTANVLGFNMYTGSGPPTLNCNPADPILAHTFYRDITGFADYYCSGTNAWTVFFGGTVAPTIWNNIGGAVAPATINNLSSGTVFQQTSAVNWEWFDITAATATTVSNPPIFDWLGGYWTGTTNNFGVWSLTYSHATGTEGAARAVFGYVGSTPIPVWQFGGTPAGGAICIAGSTSGCPEFLPQAVAGNPTYTLPTNSGTLAVSVTTPLALNAATGNMTWSLSNGTTFTATGCATLSALTGGATAGSFSTTTTGTCTITITMGSSQTAPHGWTCWGSDLTTPATFVQTGGSTTTAILKGTTASGDTMSFGCLAY